MVNHTLGTLFRVPVKKNLKAWDFLLPDAEFDYNCTPRRTTNGSPFKVVYGQKPLGPLDIAPLHQGEKMKTRASKSVSDIQ